MPIRAETIRLLPGLRASAPPAWTDMRFAVGHPRDGLSNSPGQRRETASQAVEWRAKAWIKRFAGSFPAGHVRLRLGLSSKTR